MIEDRQHHTRDDNTRHTVFVTRYHFIHYKYFGPITLLLTFTTPSHCESLLILSLWNEINFKFYDFYYVTHNLDWQLSPLWMPQVIGRRKKLKIKHTFLLFFCFVLFCFILLFFNWMDAKLYDWYDRKRTLWRHNIVATLVYKFYHFPLNTQPILTRVHPISCL